MKLTDWPLPIPQQWNQLVNTAQTEAEVEALQHAVKRGRPFGDDEWSKKTVDRPDLESTLRPRGRSQKQKQEPLCGKGRESFS